MQRQWFGRACGVMEGGAELSCCASSSGGGGGAACCAYMAGSTAQRAASATHKLYEVPCRLQQLRGEQEAGAQSSA